MDNLNFAISKYDLQEIANTEVMKVRMWIVSEGNNRHNKPIPWEAIVNSKSTLVGKPIVAKVNRFTKDFEGHEPDELPIGVVISEDDIYEETDETGKRWLVADGYIWYRYAKNASEIMERDKIKNLSMEIKVVEYGDDDSINAFVFTGITLISKTPAIPSARAEVIEFSEVADNIKHMLEDKTFSDNGSTTGDENVSKLATSIAEHIVKFFKKEDESMSKEGINPEADVKEEDINTETVDTEVDTEKVDMSAEETETDEKTEEKEESKEEFEGEEKEEEMSKEEEVDAACDEKMEEEASEDKEDSEKMEKEEDEEEMAKEEDEEKVDYEAKFNELQEQFSKVSEELETLKTFKANVEKEEIANRVECVMNEVSATDMPEEKLENWKSKVEEFENIDAWENAVKADAFTYAKKVDSKDEGVKKYAMPDKKEQKAKKGIWGNL